MIERGRRRGEREEGREGGGERRGEEGRGARVVCIGDGEEGSGGGFQCVRVRVVKKGGRKGSGEEGDRGKGGQ